MTAQVKVENEERGESILYENVLESERVPTPNFP